MANKKTYDSLDVVKWVSALLIVIIHTNPFHGSELLEFYTKDVISRIAVPLFFAISGYLFFRKITFENGKIARSQQNCTYLFRYVKHLILIYLGASSFYLLYKIPLWYSIDWWGLHALKDYLVNFFLSSSEYHLWYILASIYGIILFYILLTFIRIDMIKYLCVAGWIIECLLYSYSWMGIDDIEILTWLTSHFTVCFDAAFRAIPLMAVGLYCAKKPTKQQSSRKWLFFFGCIIRWMGCRSFLSVFLFTERKKVLVYPVHADIYIFHAELASNHKLPVWKPAHIQVDA